MTNRAQHAAGKLSKLRVATFPLEMAGVAALLFLLTSCGGINEYDNQQIESAMRDTLLTTNEFWDVSLSLLNDGKRRMILEGDYAIDYSEVNRDETVVTGSVYIQIFDSTNSRISEAWSHRAIYRAETGNFELFDSVRVATRDSTRLRTDYLQWDEETDMISTNRFVTIITPDDSLTGSSFTSKSDLTEFTLRSSGGQFIVE